MADRHGLSAAEAAIAWAHAHFGGPDSALEHVERPHRDALAATTGDARTWSAQDAAEEKPERVLESTSPARQDQLVARLPEPWMRRLSEDQSTEPREPRDARLDAFVSHSLYEPLLHGAHRIPHRPDLLGAQEHTLDIGWLLSNLGVAPRAVQCVGTALLATLTQGMGRRELARQSMLLPEYARDWYVSRLSQPLVLTEASLQRLGQVYRQVHNHYPDWGETLLHLGLSCWVCAAAPRHPRRLRRLGQLWSRRWARGSSDPVAEYLHLHSIEAGRNASSRAARQAFSLEMAQALRALIPDVRAILEVS